MLDIVTALAEEVSLLLIVACSLLMGILSLRTKTVKSFQFQMFVVLLVLLVAEAPHILSDSGLIDISGIEDVGLVVHTISMIFLVAFILLRAASYFRQGKKS